MDPGVRTGSSSSPPKVGIKVACPSVTACWHRPKASPKSWNDLNAAQGKAPEFSESERTAIGAGTDWQDEVFDIGRGQNHQLSISGGQEKFTYYASLNYLGQQGIVTGSGIGRYAARANLGYSDQGRFNFGMNLNTARIVDDFVPNGISINESAGIVNTMLFQDPTLPVRDADGRYAQSNVVNLENPMALAKGVADQAASARVFGSAWLEYWLLAGLSVKLNGGTDLQNSRRDTYVGRDTRRGGQANGLANVQTATSGDALLELTARYAKRLNEHSFEILAGYTFQQFGHRRLAASAQGFPTDAFRTDNLAAGANGSFRISTFRGGSRLRSWLGRANYSFRDRYLLTVSFRSDGSSRFGAVHKYGYFPSGALGWNIGREGFLSENGTVSALKLRTSYGSTGNQEIGNYRSLVLLGTQGQAIFGDAAHVGISTNQLANPDLRWETTRQFNLGLDFGLWNGRIEGSLDYYRKTTRDLLIELPIPTTTGFPTTLANVGSMANKGFDLQLNTANLQGKLRWTSSLNLSAAHNKVTGIGGLPDILQGSVGFFNRFSRIAVGEPLNYFYGYQVVGVLQQGETYAPQPLSQPGELKFRDANGDGTINAADRTNLGSPFPDFTYGIGNSFSYGRFDLSFFFEGMSGGKILNLNISESENPISFRRNRLARSYTDRWTPDNPTNDNPSGLVPSFAYADASGTINSRAVQSASYLRLKNLTFGYDIPSPRAGIFRSARIYFAAQNLFTLSDYMGYDPAVTSFGTSNIRADYNSYPLARTYSLGVNVKF